MRRLSGILIDVFLASFVGIADTAAADFEAAASPVTAGLCEAMKQHHVLNENPPVSCDRLSVIKFAYTDFEGQSHSDGEIVILDAAADELLEALKELRRRGFPIARAKSIHLYEGDDHASMADDNTSAFNHRNIAGSSNISLHAYGAAIDLNPVENPFVTRGGNVSPPSGRAYLRRLPEGSDEALRAGMAEAVIDVFAYHGFVEWGGDWGGPTDYQHFQIPRKFAIRLGNLPSTQAKALFETNLALYIACRKENGSGKAARKLCQGKVYP